MDTHRAPALAAAAGFLLLLTGCGAGSPDGKDASAPAGDPTSAPTSSSSAPSGAASDSESDSGLDAGTGTTASDTAGPKPLVLHPDRLRTGDRPRIAIEVGRWQHADDQTWRLVRPDGSSLVLGSLGTDFAPMGDGLVGVLTGEVSEAFVVDGTGKDVRREPMRGYRLAVSPDGSIVGWLDVHGTSQVVEAGGRRTWSMPRVNKGIDIAAVLGRQTCKEGLDGSGCSVFVNGPKGTFVSVSHGFVDIVPKVRQVADAATRSGVAAVDPSSPGGTCSGVRSWAGHWRWQTCDYLLQTFAPGGRRIVGTDAVPTSYDQHRVGVFSRTGRLLVAFRTPPDAFIRQLAWEDEAHLLAVVHSEHAWTVLRLGVDGGREIVLGPRRAGAGLSPFILPTR